MGGEKRGLPHKKTVSGNSVFWTSLKHLHLTSFAAIKAATKVAKKQKFGEIDQGYYDYSDTTVGTPQVTSG